MEGVKRLVDAVPVPELIADEASADDAQLVVEAALEPAVEQAPVTVERPDGGLSIVRLPNGGLCINAPPALAGPLADLLEGLVQALRAR